jgi:3-oxoacyl-[acyl-carrier-protein] synthase II
MRAEQAVNISGIGVVFARGRGIDSLDCAMRSGWMPPTQIGSPAAAGEPQLAYHVEPEILADSKVLKKMRRADKFIRMAVLAAWDAVQDSGITLDGEKNSLGIIVATALGPHATTFRFLDDILEYGDAEVSPTVFSHSVHNAAASYISTAVQSRGPTLTVTQFGFAFHHALMLAGAWLREGRCKYVLAGSVDECGAVMEYVCAQKLRIAVDGRIKPFLFSATPTAVPGEGSVFFLLTREEEAKKYCRIAGVSVNDGSFTEGAPDLCIVDADGMTGGEAAYLSVLLPGVYAAGYAPVYGSMMTGSAFSCAAGALMLEKQIRYASPVQDNPHGISLCTATESAAVEKIRCVKMGCANERATIQLKR